MYIYIYIYTCIHIYIYIYIYIYILLSTEQSLKGKRMRNWLLQELEKRCSRGKSGLLIQLCLDHYALPISQLLAMLILFSHPHGS